MKQYLQKQVRITLMNKSIMTQCQLVGNCIESWHTHTFFSYYKSKNKNEYPVIILFLYVCNDDFKFRSLIFQLLGCKHLI